jgi:hypothetical protein
MENPQVRIVEVKVRPISLSKITPNTLVAILAKIVKRYHHQYSERLALPSALK